MRRPLPAAANEVAHEPWQLRVHVCHQHNKTRCISTPAPRQHSSTSCSKGARLSRCRTEQARNQQRCNVHTCVVLGESP
jgi:hypothetical protein